MAFLNRLFNRKSKTELVSSQATQQQLRRSLTDPNPPTIASQRARTSSSDERDTFDIYAPSRLSRPRRVGCDFTRAKTSVESGSVRSSNSSAADPAYNIADGVKGQYRQLKPLHRSRLHTIMAAQDRSSKRTVVMKTVYKSRLSAAMRTKLESEVQHLRTLAGVPGVVQYLNHFEDDECFYIVLERCPGLTLIELIANCGGRLPEHVLVPYILIPLTLLLADLHRRGVVHRQLKPEHVLCCHESASITLVDFAEAVNAKQRCLNNRAGALEYMAPEVLDKPTAEEVFHQVLSRGISEEELPQYDEKADVWSLGALTYEALTGCQPFLADSPADMGALQRELLASSEPPSAPTTPSAAGGGSQRLFAGRSLSPEARSFLTQALQLDPTRRPSAEALLQHPLLRRYWTRYQDKQVALLASSSVGSVAAAAAAAEAGGAAAGAVPAVAVAPAPPPRALARPVWTEVGIAAVAATGSPMRGSVRGPTAVTPATACCGAPSEVAQANVLVAAPLQFSVR
ncbi:hypothetical protein Agub_g1302 [Astrephomene gubernaculifera]|uniref:Protein kinase domain-containing protein n=1 Tax=Astrephomene gubernaculifera TaxID=47775 RepID=A0AAD3DI39_9CHLO|nr:hypothetical protein Agub_g1302 [Astrephomene gubernaculifera]